MPFNIDHPNATVGPTNLTLQQLTAGDSGTLPRLKWAALLGLLILSGIVAFRGKRQ